MARFGSTAFRVLALSTSICASITNYAIVFSIAPQMARTFGIPEQNVGFFGGMLTGKCRACACVCVFVCVCVCVCVLCVSVSVLV